MISPNGISTILFDLDGTLRHSRPSSIETFFALAAEMGIPDKPERRRQALRWVHYYWADSKELLEDQERFGEKDELFWTNHARLNLIAFGCQEEQAAVLAPEIRRRMAEEHQPEEWIPPETYEILEALQHSGFRLGVLSNRTEPYRETLESSGLLSYFDLVLAAGEVRVWKPDPRVFQHALERLNVRPEETLYVGDNYFADVVGAQAAGISPVLLDPDGIFPEASCPVIRSLKDLEDILSAEKHLIPARSSSTNLRE